MRNELPEGRGLRVERKMPRRRLGSGKSREQKNSEDAETRSHWDTHEVKPFSAQRGKLSLRAIILFVVAANMGEWHEIPLLLRTENAIVSYVRYLRQLLWPTDLALFYPHATLPLTLVIASIFLLVAISTAVLYFGRKFPYLITGWGWYLVMLLPVIGLVQVGAQAMADRYTYLPQIGIVLAITWTAADAAAGTRQLQRFMAFWSRRRR
jgi:hypothetical protein